MCALVEVLVSISPVHETNRVYKAQSFHIPSSGYFSTEFNMATPNSLPCNELSKTGHNSFPAKFHLFFNQLWPKKLFDSSLLFLVNSHITSTNWALSNNK